MQDRFRCELVSWHTSQRLARRLALGIRDSGYRPDVIVAIARGGFVPARILCDYLAITNLTSIRIVHYTTGARKAGEARLTEGLGIDVHDARVLIADDVSDTGDTLALARRHVEDFAPADVRIAVIHHKRGASVRPDYYAHHVVRWRWITYPWAVLEDASGFIEQMAVRPRSAEDAAKRLEADYGMRPGLFLVQDALDLLTRESTTRN
jgi:hypoxanthine phosphoribosyltransferase